MADEVPDDTQAQAAIKLSDNVRELIRKEVIEAFADYGFANDLMRVGKMQYETQFKEAVRQAIMEQLNKS
tara:strand:+ start:448 stop:657 length:210 start_codon:yes stop_codon:yes gene_type:complete